MRFIKQFPTAAAGLALGIAGMATYCNGLVPESLCSQIAFDASLLLVLVLLAPVLWKFIKHPDLLWSDLAHASVGSTIPTITMTMMLLSYAISKYSIGVASVIWLLSVGVHIVFLIIFAYYRLRNFDFNHVVPSWFVPPVGLIIACLTLSNNFFLPLAYVILGFGITCYFILLPIIMYRIFLKETFDDSRKPLIAALAAPASLTLAGYLSIVHQPNPILVMLLFGIAVLMTAIVYIMFIHLMRLPFIPACSVYTFPLVISATALYKMSLWANTNDLFREYSQWFFYSSIVEAIIALLVILYILQHYYQFIKKLIINNTIGEI